MSATTDNLGTSRGRLILLVGLWLFLAASCLPKTLDTPLQKNRISETVNQTFEAIETGNRDLLSDVAPPLAEIDEATMGQLQNSLVQGVDWSVTDIEIARKSAVASVILSSREGSMSDRNSTVTILVPLEYDGDRWLVAETLSVTREYSVVPAK